MAWIESHETVWEHHKTVKLCKILNISKPQAVGHLHGLWHFTLRNAWKNADLEAWGDDEIARASHWEGEKSVYVNALRECGFLDGFVVHGWAKRAGRLVYDRLRKESERLSAVKRRKKGGKSKATVPNPSVPYRTVPKDHSASAEANVKEVNKDNNGKGTPKQLTSLQRVVMGFKIRSGAEKDDQAWDKAYWARYSKSGKQLLGLMGGDSDMALDCTDDVCDWLEKKGLSWTPETIVKHAFSWKQGRLGK